MARATKGDGSIRSKGKGIWEVRVAFGKDPITGKYRSVSRTVRGTKAEARKVRDELRKQHESGLSYDGSKATFQEFAVNEWYARRVKSYEATGQPAKTTLSDNLTIINSVSRYIGSVRLANIDHYAIDKLFDKLNEERDKPLTGSRLKKYYVVLNGIFKLALKYDIVIRNPIEQVDAPRCEEAERKTLDRREAFMLQSRIEEAEAQAYAKLAAIEHRREERECSDVRKRVCGIDGISRIIAVRIALATGARRGEILALDWASLDFGNHLITISKSLTINGELKAPKTKSGVRSFPIKDERFWKSLEEWKERQSEYLGSLPIAQTEQTPIVCSATGGHIGTSNFSRWWASHRDELGCAGLRFHELRHTQASLLEANNVPIATIAKRLGHSKVSTTYDFYSHSLQEEDERAADVFAEIVNRPTFQIVQKSA